MSTATTTTTAHNHDHAEKERLVYETALEFRESCKKMLKASKQYEEAGRVFTQQGSLFAEELLKHVDKIGRQSHLAPSLIYFGNTIVATMSVQEQMLNEINSNFEVPLSNFVDYDFAELAELKKKTEKAKSEYDAAVIRIGGSIRKKRDSHWLSEYERELEGHKVTFKDSEKELSAKLDELNSKQETKFLRYLAMFMTAQNQYFVRGAKLFQNLKPRMDAIQQHIAQIDIRDGVKEGHLMKKGNRYYYVLKGGWLHCYKGKMELDEKNALNILLCSVKIPSSYASADNDKRFEIMNPAKKHSIVLQAETEKERDEWVAAIQESISSTLNAQSTGNSSLNSSGRRNSPAPPGDTLRPLKILQEVHGNTICADCDSRDPDWASINLGILVCKECSGVHRSLGTHISKVRSLTLDKWAPESLLLMRAIGNQKFNEVFEQSIREDAPTKPTHKSDRAHRERWIKTKYQHKEFLAKGNMDQAQLNHMLFERLSTPNRDLFQILLLVAQGANTNFVSAENDNRTPLHQCVYICDDSVMVEFLLQNGADLFKKERRGWTAAHYAAFVNRYRSARVLLSRGFESSKERVLDARGRVALDLAILNGAKETETLFRSVDPTTGELTLDDVENGVIPTLTLTTPLSAQLPPVPEETEEEQQESDDEYDDDEDIYYENAKYNYAHFVPRAMTPFTSPPLGSPQFPAANTAPPTPTMTRGDSFTNYAPASPSLPTHPYHLKNQNSDQVVILNSSGSFVGFGEKKKKGSFFGRKKFFGKDGKDDKEKEDKEGE